MLLTTVYLVNHGAGRFHAAQATGLYIHGIQPQLRDLVHTSLNILVSGVTNLLQGMKTSQGVTCAQETGPQCRYRILTRGKTRNGGMMQAQAPLSP